MARDLIHDAVKSALIKDGWVIVADPFKIETADVRVYADLAADLATDRPLAAEKSGNKIVVEIKSFAGRSWIGDMYEALGQYLIYLQLLKATGSDRKLWLAVNDVVYYDFFQTEAIQEVIEEFNLAILVVNTLTEEVEEWKS